MIFGTRQDCHFYFNSVCHKSDNCIDFKYFGVIFRQTGHFHQTRNHNVEQARKTKHVLLNELKIVIFQLISQLYFTCSIMLVAYGALQEAKLLKVYIMLVSHRLLV